MRLDFKLELLLGLLFILAFSGIASAEICECAVESDCAADERCAPGGMCTEFTKTVPPYEVMHGTCEQCYAVGATCTVDVQCCKTKLGRECATNIGAAGGNCGRACCPIGQEYINTGTGCRCQSLAEICNGVDDDFDGSIDEGFACRQGSTCCDSSCNLIANNADPGDAYCPSTCQVCNGAGACKNADDGTDPGNDCFGGGPCLTLCTKNEGTGVCSGGACGEYTASLASGSVCQLGTGNTIIPTSTINCGAYNACTAGTCSGTRYYLSCNAGGGVCRVGSDTVGASSTTIYANAGSSLTAACGVSGASPCDATFRLSPGPGDNNYGIGGSQSCQGFCDGSGICDYAGNCGAAVFCGDGIITAPETCELPSTSNNANCGQSTSQCVGARVQTRDGFGNCNIACGCAFDAWGGLTCTAGTCGAVCSNGASQACVVGGYPGTQTCDAVSCNWGPCIQIGGCGNGILESPPEACEPIGSCQPGLLCNALCQWQATSETIASGNCNDNLDNDCDSEDDWDTLWGALHGDAGCPVGVTAINGPAIVCPAQNFQVRCTRSTPVVVNSISARIDGQSACSFNSWSGADGIFDCTAPAAFGSYTVRCYVDATKSYVTPPDRTYSLSVGGAACCAQYTVQGQAICEGDGSCDWCPECSGTLYSGSTSRCVVAGSCNYFCNRDPADLTAPYDYCGAVCDNTDAPCPVQTRCTGTIYETNSAVCSPACACSYAGWTKGTCTQSEANCAAACSTGEAQPCVTVAGYPGTQTCDEATCTFGLCTSALSCGDSVVTMPVEQCDPPGLCQPPGDTGSSCNASCQWQATAPESSYPNGCINDINDDCDNQGIDGSDPDCPEGSGIIGSINRGCNDGVDNDGDGFTDLEDPGCCDFCLANPAYGFDNFSGEACGGVGCSCAEVNISWEERPPQQDYCCGNNALNEFFNSTLKNSNPNDDVTSAACPDCPRYACCNDSSHCVDATGKCQTGVEETFDLCLDGLDNDCDGLIDGADTRCGGNVAGFVFNDMGFRVPGAVVKSSPPGMASSFENSTITDAAGHYELRSILGNYTFIARREGYDDNAAFVNVLPDGVTQVNFTLRNGSCHADCTDYYGNCNPACEGLSFVNSSGQLETCNFINPLCYDRPKNFGATHKNPDTNITTEYTCCKGPERTYKTLKATVTGNMKDLYDYVLNVKFMGKQAKLHILTWNSEE